MLQKEGLRLEELQKSFYLQLPCTHTQQEQEEETPPNHQLPSL